MLGPREPGLKVPLAIGAAIVIALLLGAVSQHPGADLRKLSFPCPGCMKYCR
jgi:hypothetical protein